MKRIAAPLALWTAVAALAVPAAAQTDGFALDRFRAAPTMDDGLALQLPSTLEHLRWSTQLTLDYGRRPLASEGYMADAGETVNIVANRIVAQGAFAMGLGDRAQMSLVLPFTVFQNGDSPTPGGLDFDEPIAAGLGDIQLGGAVRVFGDPDSLQLGAHVGVLVPSGSDGALSGDSGVGLRGSASLAYDLKALLVGLEVGAAYRPRRQYGFLTAGSEAFLRAGVQVPLVADLKLLVEVDGATRVQGGQAFSDNANPLEALVGALYRQRDGWGARLAVGLGLLSGVGSPSVRVLGGFGYSPPVARPAQAAVPATQPVPPAPAEAESVVQAEPEPEPISADRDIDGIPDQLDQCLDAPEDLDGFEDEDGCPDMDDDKDGIHDAVDACPRAPEDFDGVDDRDGCPDEDEDEVAPEPEPEPVAQAEPTVTGAEPQPNTGDRPDHIHFDRNTARLTEDTRRELWGALNWLAKRPGKLELVVEGYASAEGDDARNELLASTRAKVVSRWLKQRAGWLQQRDVTIVVKAAGRGTSAPVADNDTEAGRRKNRRVELRATRVD